MNFIEKAKAKHGDRYDYSQVDYKNGRTPVTVICPYHGSFQVCPEYHLRKSGTLGCPTCSKLAQNQKQTLSTERAIERFKAVHGDAYDYTQVVYASIHMSVTIVCKTHGPFEQTPNNHRKGMGCPQCGRQRTAESQLKTTEQFVAKAKEVHGNKYDYSKTVYENSKKAVTITCPEHGDFNQVPYVHLAKKGCRACSISASKVEARIAEWCEAHQIVYKREVVIREFNKYKRFDFYFPEIDCYVEIDGVFHWLPICGKKRLEQQQERDKLTNEWCAQHGINLQRFGSYDACLEFLASAFHRGMGRKTTTLTGKVEVSLR